MTSVAARVKPSAMYIRTAARWSRRRRACPARPGPAGEQADQGHRSAQPAPCLPDPPRPRRPRRSRGCRRRAVDLGPVEPGRRARPARPGRSRPGRTRALLAQLQVVRVQAPCSGWWAKAGALSRSQRSSSRPGSNVRSRHPGRPATARATGPQRAAHLQQGPDPAEAGRGGQFGRGGQVAVGPDPQRAHPARWVSASSSARPVPWRRWPGLVTTSALATPGSSHSRWA